MRVISVLSTKGGVGKTTTTANLGGLLADAGLSVLLIDADSQPSLSSYYPITRKAPGSARAQARRRSSSPRWRR